MSLVRELRRDHSMTSRLAVSRCAVERLMVAANNGRDECIRALQGSTTTHRSDDGGVVIELHAVSVSGIEKRARLWEREAELQQVAESAFRSCVVIAWRNYSHRCRIAARLKAAALSRHEMDSTRVECEMRRQESAAHDAAAERSQRGRPLVVCHASNAPNGVSVSKTELRHAAMQTKVAVT